LATRLGLPFVDADTEIENAAGMSIADIFDRFGEPYFRDGERRVIARLIDGKPKVIATGGGAFINEATRALILSDALAIWLDAPVEILAERVRRRDTRPLLRGRDPVQVLRDLAAIRNPLYALAPIRVASANAPHDTTVRAILEALGRRDGPAARAAMHAHVMHAWELRQTSEELRATGRVGGDAPGSAAS